MRAVFQMTVKRNHTNSLVLVYMCTYDVTKKTADKFLMTGIFEAGDRGSPPRMMQA